MDGDDDGKHSEDEKSVGEETLEFGTGSSECFDGSQRNVRGERAQVE